MTPDADGIIAAHNYMERRERDLEARIKRLEDALIPLCLICEPDEYRRRGETHVSRMVKVSDVQTARDARGWDS